MSQEGLLALVDAVVVDDDRTGDAGDATKEEDTRWLHSWRSPLKISQATVTNSLEIQIHFIRISIIEWICESNEIRLELISNQ